MIQAQTIWFSSGMIVGAIIAGIGCWLGYKRAMRDAGIR